MMAQGDHRKKHNAGATGSYQRALKQYEEAVRKAADISPQVSEAEETANGSFL
jgi:hypothetical protein